MKILCNWQPSSLNRLVIAREFREMLDAHGIPLTSEQVNIRPPRRLTKEDETKKWHQDDNQNRETPTSGLLLILWANKNPTLVRDKATRRRFGAVRDGDVLLIAH